MAEKKATLIIELKDFASKNLRGVTDAFFAVKAGVMAFQQTFGRLISFMGDSLSSFAASEMAVTKLNVALKNQGIYTEAYSKSLQDQALALQSLSTHSDEAILDTQSLLTTFGLAGVELKSATKAALDLSAGLGVDLRTATLLLGKAWTGETGSLARYGLKIDQTLKGAEAFAAVLGQVNSRFGGSAAAEASTYAGRLAVLTNKFDDLKEKIGKELIPVAETWTDWLTRGVDAINRYVEGGSDKMTNSTDRVLVSIRAHIQGIKDEMEAHGENTVRYKILEKDLERAAFGYKKLAEAKGISARTAEAAPASKVIVDDETRKADQKEQAERMSLQRSAQAKLDSAVMSKDQLELLQDESDARMIEKSIGREAADEFTTGRSLAREKTANAQKAKNFADTLSFISTLSTSKNKELALIGKAAGISLAYINTGVAITRALAAAPPPFNFALAAAVGAAGAAQIAVIAGAPLAQGGMMMPQSGGSRAIMAEAGKAEVAIPLDDERTTERLARTLGPAIGGGGETHVHVHAGVVVADRVSVTEFAKQIDEELYKLGRSRQRIS